jgi:hypothetical protein
MLSYRDGSAERLNVENRGARRIIFSFREARMGGMPLD